MLGVCVKVSEIFFNEREQFGISRCARKMRYRGVNAVCFDEVLNFDGLFIFGVIELQRGGNDRSEFFRVQAVASRD